MKPDTGNAPDDFLASMFTVTDVKEMGYCARIVYYQYCLPALQPVTTFKMEAGAEAGQATEDLEHRRSLRAYQLQAGQREYDVWLESAALGLRGRVDMLITTGRSAGDPADRPTEVIPVDFKNTDNAEPGADEGGTGGVHASWQLQLAAYALMVEEQRGCQVTRGFIYLIPVRQSRLVDLTPELKQAVRTALDRMRQMVARESMPEATEYASRCKVCEYRLFCNDV